MVNCPYCRLGVAESPDLAGQVVACPGCRNQFQMPVMSQPPLIVQPTAAPPASGGYRPRPKKSSKQAIMIFGAILALAGFILTTAAKMASRAANQPPRNQVRPSAGPQGVATKGSSRVTLATYERVKPGMSLREVTAILGSDYEQTGADKYVWAATNLRGICHVVFQNGVVIHKSQANLP